MPTLIMYWDETNLFGDPISDIRIEQNYENIEVPLSACGFRLRRPDGDWLAHWYFAPPRMPSMTFVFQSVSYSASNPNTGTAELIEARGPVRGCSGGSGDYVFVTPLGSLGIVGNDPITAGAGSFLAEFTDETNIEWLDFAGEVIEIEFPEPSVEPQELPPEFFEEPPEVKGCFRDFEGNLHCPEDADSTGQAVRGTSSGGVALLIAENDYLIPGLVETGDLSLPAEPLASGEPLEIRCPAELRLTVRFVKSASAPAATVRYRFRFAHGPRSTVFEKRIDGTGITTVVHTVPVPLPVPSRPTPGGGGISGPDEFAVFRPPIDPIPTTPDVQLDDARLTVEPLPDNEHKGSVRVEVVNGADGIIASGWATYHLVCEDGTERPVVTPGLFGAGVVSLQANLNRWLGHQGRRRLNLDGRFGNETTQAVVGFQGQSGLVTDGIVGPRTWSALRRSVNALDSGKGGKPALGRECRD